MSFVKRHCPVKIRGILGRESIGTNLDSRLRGNDKLDIHVLLMFKQNQQ
jgi:hypothetical protein